MKKIILMFLFGTVIVGYTVAATDVIDDFFGKEATYKQASEIDWFDSPIPGGVKISPVAGNIQKGAHMTMVRMPAGTRVPMHTHSNGYVGVVIKGNMRHPVKGKKKTDILLPPGSHWALPARVDHVSECLPGAECVALIYQKAPFEFSVSK